MKSPWFRLSMDSRLRGNDGEAGGNDGGRASSVQSPVHFSAHTHSHMSTPNPAAVKAWLLDLQARIVQALEEVDGKPFLCDAWERAEGGGGISRLIEEGNVFERGG